MVALPMLLLIAVTSADAQRAGASIDHVILGASDLDSAMVDFERRTGVKPAFGGVHPGQGTRNAIVRVGEGAYLEILAPDPAQKVSGTTAAELVGLRRMTPVGWAVGTSDVARLRDRLRRAGFRPDRLSPGSRRRPNGQRISWVTVDIAGIHRNIAPFFIQWRNPAQHPSRSAPGGCRLHQLAIATPQPAPLQRLIAELRLEVHVARKAKSRIGLSLDCPKGRVTF